MPKVLHFLSLPFSHLSVGLFWNEEPRIWPQQFPDFVKQLLTAVLLEKILNPLHQILEKPEVDVMQYIGFEGQGNFDT